MARKQQNRSTDKFFQTQLGSGSYPCSVFFSLVTRGFDAVGELVGYAVNAACKKLGIAKSATHSQVTAALAARRYRRRFTLLTFALVFILRNFVALSNLLYAFVRPVLVTFHDA